MVLPNTKIYNWLSKKISNFDGTLVPIHGDASPRQYYRVALPEKNLIVMDASNAQESQLPFVCIAQCLSGQGLLVPQVIHQDISEGFLVLSDLGDDLYLNKLDENTVEPLYQSAMKSLIKIQQTSDPINYPLPLFDANFITTELQRFSDWFLQRYLQWDVPVKIENKFKKLFQLLITNALEQPQVFVHRDYHSRNLLVCEDNQPGILDFQDAVRGPVTYDLVSLLRDCYISWRSEQVSKWVLDYKKKIEVEGMLKNHTDEEFLRWFDLMGLQRHLKVLGIFSRLYIRDNKPRYLDDIPLILKYVTDVLEKHQEIKQYADIFHTEIMPRLEQNRSIRKSNIEVVSK